MRKKVLALVLALCMVLTLLPTTVFAAQYAIEPGDGQTSFDDLATRLGSKATVDKVNKTITLTDDITLNDGDTNSNFIFADDIKIILDSHKLDLGTKTDSSKQIDVALGTFNGSKMEIVGPGTVDGGIKAQLDGNVVLTNVTVDGYVSCIGEDATPKATLTVTGGIINGGQGEALIVTGGTATVTETTIKNDIEDRANATVATIYLQDGTDKHPASLTLNQCTITGTVLSTAHDGVKDSNNFPYTNAKLEINGGTIDGGAGSALTIGGTTAGVIVTGTTIKSIIAEGSAVYVQNGSEGNAVPLTLKNCTVTSEDNGIFVAAYGHLTVDGGSVTGKSFGISTNGGNEKNPNNSIGAEITVNNAAVTGGDTACGVYLPAGKMTVSGEEAHIKGGAGIVVRGGELDLEGGTVEATSTSNDITVGDAKDEDGQPVKVPAAGITVDNAGYPAQDGGQKHVTITEDATVTAPEGGKTVAATNKGEEVKAETEGKVKPEENPFDIKGGKLMVAGEPDEDNVTKFLNKGYEYAKGEITENTETTAKFEAEIVGGLKYETLEEALTHVVKGDTIKLLNDVKLPGTMEQTNAKDRIEIKNEITIDLNGHELKKNDTLKEDKAGMLIGANGKLTITDTTGTGKITGKGTLLLANENGELTIEDGVTITQEKGADDNNDTAVATNGGTLTINGGTITADESGVGVFGTGTLTVNGGTIDAEAFGIATNGSKTQATAKIEIKGGTITSSESAGVYLPNGELEMSEGDITGKAGIVSRGGKLDVTGGNVTATGTDKLVVGDAEASSKKVEVEPAAVVVDKSGTGYGNGSTTLSGGEFKATEGKPAVVYSESGENKSTTDANANEKLTVKGGYYSSSLAETKLLDPSLNTEAETTEGEYSYFTSPAEAEKQLAEDNKTAAEDGIKVIDTTKASIVKVGFLTEKDDEYLNSLTELVTEDTKAEWKEGGITDSGKNTFYAVFKAGSEDETSGGQTYTVEFSDGGTHTYSEEVASVNKGGIVYFIPNGQTIPTTDFQGKYTVTLTKDSESSPVSTATLEVYKVTYKAGEKVTAPSTSTVTVYTDKADLETALNAHPEGFTLKDGANFWSSKTEPEKITDGTYAYTVTLSGYYASTNPTYTVTVPANPNGTVTVSPRSATAGTTITVTVTPKEGYSVDTVTVTQNGTGTAVTVTKNADGTYSFTMPAGGATVKATFVEGEKPAPSAKFTDVVKDAWYVDAIDYVVEKGLMGGTGETTFAPNDQTDRAMLVTILYRLDGEPAVTKDIPFSDVPAGKWYSDAINWAAANEIVGGYGDGTFRPDRDLTREEAATILYRYATYKKYDVTTTAELTAYTDAASVQSYATASMSWAVGTELINGTTATTLAPNGGAIRAQIATILMRFCENIVK